MPYPMLPDYQKTYAERNDERFDLAQVQLEVYLSKKGYPYIRFGWDEKNDRVPSELWYKFPDFIRSMPDNIVIHPKYGFVFMEAKGCRDYLGIKQDDVDLYLEWDKIAQLFIATYATATETLYIVPLVVIVSIMEDDKTIRDRYPDNDKIYFKIPLEYLESYKQNDNNRKLDSTITSV